MAYVLASNLAVITFFMKLYENHKINVFLIKLTNFSSVSDSC